MRQWFGKSRMWIRISCWMYFCFKDIRKKFLWHNENSVPPFRNLSYYNFECRNCFFFASVYCCFLQERNCQRTLWSSVVEVEDLGNHLSQLSLPRVFKVYKLIIECILTGFKSSKTQMRFKALQKPKQTTKIVLNSMISHDITLIYIFFVQLW